ncbi:MAG: response regulator [Pseudomonadota bacterium]
MSAVFADSEHLPGVDEQVNILIVDDEPKNLLVLETVLDDPGYRLIRANSGDEALLQLVTHEFAVLVLDVRMPGMTGFELARMIKERKKTAAIPIIFLTAYYNEDQHILEGYGKGAVDYLHKPVNPPVLRSKVAVFAELYRRGRAVRIANRALTMEVADRRRAEARLGELNATLDKRVTERTEALQASEALLREANRRKDEFLATLAHELRNPLAPVRNAAQLLRMAGLRPEQLRWACDLIDRQVASMSRLIDDLMDVSRINQGKLELRRQSTSLAAVLRDAAEASRPLMEEFGHQFRMLLPTEEMEIDGDPVRLAQAFMNLLNNAAKYTEKGGTIEVAAASVDGWAKVTVKDNGIGIAADRLESVFGMFSQVETALERSRGGLGIGLALSRRLIEMHGGNIVAQSAGSGAGSEFTVRVPLAHQRQGALPCSVDPHTEAIDGVHRSIRILIADDNVDAASTLSMLMEMMGNEVKQVNDGAAAVDAVASFRPQVALLDIGMPKLNGYQACEKIRQLDGGQDIVIIAVTGWGQPDDRRKSAEAGFNHHLVKPVDPSELAQLLEQISAP